MKSKICYIFIVLFVILQVACVHTDNAMATEEDDVRNVVVQFLQYLKSGNTDGVLELITEPMLTERTELLQRNPNYPVILMDAYQDTDFEVVSVDKVDDFNYTVTVNSLVENEVVKKTMFICQKNYDSWQISEEVRQGI